jgi:hypothetical protein
MPGFADRQRAVAGLDQARSTGSVGAKMNVEPRNARRVLAAITIALAVAGCGGGGDDGSAVAPSPATSTDVESSELAGVYFDVRRDPG